MRRRVRRRGRRSRCSARVARASRADRAEEGAHRERSDRRARATCSRRSWPTSRSPAASRSPSSRPRSPSTCARDGKADLVVSHYGHRNLEQFVLDGLGEWPRTIFSNQMALVGPPSDPAKVRGLGDVVEAFKRIAAKKSPFLLNGSDGGHYLVDLIWNAAGRPNKAGWFLDDGLKKEASVRLVDDTARLFDLGADSVRALREGSAPRPRAARPRRSPAPARPRVHAREGLEGARRERRCRESRSRRTCSPRSRRRRSTRPATRATHAMWTPAGRHNRSNFLPKD